MKYPGGEHVWVAYYDQAHELRFIVTSKQGSRSYYYLYKCIDGKFCKLGRDRSPTQLEEVFNVAGEILSEA